MTVNVLTTTPAHRTLPDTLVGVRTYDAGHHTTTTITLDNSGKLKIQGAAPITTTLSSIDSVTGSAGAWVVTATLADNSGISVGDVALVRNITPGIKVPGDLTTRPGLGQLNIGFFAMGELATSGTSVTLSGSDATTFFNNGDLALIRGQVKSVSSVTDSAFTISSALAGDVTGLQYWYHLIPATGTVTCAGTTVTGTGTSFLSQVNVGDLLALEDEGIARVTAIATDTSLTISKTHTVTGAVFGVISTTETHEGAWVVSTVGASNSVTWTNTGETTQGKPPVNLVTGGDVTVLTTVLNFASGDGIVVKSGSIELDDIALVGNGVTTTTSGLSLDEGGNAAHAVMSGTTAICAFGYGASLATGGSLYAASAFFSSNTSRGVYCREGGDCWVANATLSGNGSYGIFVGPGSHARGADVRLLCNGIQGARLEVGASAWLDFAYAIANGDDGILAMGHVALHLTGFRFIKNGGRGLEAQNGTDGRATGSTFICNIGAGYALSHASLELNQTISVGNEAGGGTIDRSNVALTEAAATYIPGSGLHVTSGSTVTCNDFHVVGCTTYGLSVENGSRVYAEDISATGNTINDVRAVTGAKVWTLGGGTGLSVYPTADQQQEEGEAVYTDSADGVWVDKLRVGDYTDTATVSGILKTSSAYNFGTVAANSQATNTFTVTGARATDTIAVNYNGTIPNGLIWSYQITGNNTVTITVTNVTGASIAAGNRTYYISVIRF